MWLSRIPILLLASSNFVPYSSLTTFPFLSFFGGSTHPFNTPAALVGSLGFEGRIGFGGKASTAPAAWSTTLASPPAVQSCSMAGQSSFSPVNDGSGLTWDDSCEKCSYLSCGEGAL
jgi:hypothetical protein